MTFQRIESSGALPIGAHWIEVRKSLLGWFPVDMVMTESGPRLHEALPARYHTPEDAAAAATVTAQERQISVVLR